LNCIAFLISLGSGRASRTCNINKLEPARDHGISSFFPGFGALNGTDRTAVLGGELPEKVY
jgi:hypothetical protein